MTLTLKFTENQKKSLLELAKDSTIMDESVFFQKLEEILKNQGIERPPVSGQQLKQLKTWIDTSLEVGNECVGELVEDLFKDYSNFQNKNSNVVLAKRSFAPALVYILGTVKHQPEASLLGGRAKAVTHLQLKK